MADLIIEARDIITNDIGIRFKSVDIDWSESTEEIKVKATKANPDGVKTVSTFAPFITAYHGFDEDGNVESYTQKQIDRLAGNNDGQSDAAMKLVG